MSQIELKIVANTAAEIAVKLKELLDQFGATPHAAPAKVTATREQATVAETAEEAPPAAAAPKRRSSKPAATKQVAPPAEETQEEVATLTYDEVRPVLVKLSSHKNGGRDAAKALVASYGVKNGQDIPADKLAEAKAKAEKILVDLDSAEDEADSDFEV